MINSAVDVRIIMGLNPPSENNKTKIPCFNSASETSSNDLPEETPVDRLTRETLDYIDQYYANFSKPIPKSRASLIREAATSAFSMVALGSVVYTYLTYRNLYERLGSEQDDGETGFEQNDSVEAPEPV